jgi:serine/threonine protein kinase
VLIDIARHAKLADFGLCVIGEATAGKLTQTASNMEAGHICYLAPERFNPETQGSRWRSAVDVYAFACMCILVRTSVSSNIPALMFLELLTSSHPFQDMYERSQYSVMFAVSKGDRPARPDHLFGLAADDMWILIQDCWHQEPDARPEMISVHQQLQAIHIP